MRPSAASASRRGRAPSGSGYSRIDIVSGSMVASLFEPNSQKTGSPCAVITIPYGFASRVGTSRRSSLPFSGSSRPTWLACCMVNHTRPRGSMAGVCGSACARGTGNSTTFPVFGSSLPSLFAFCSVNQSEPSGAAAGSCGRASGVGRRNSRMETGAAARSAMATAPRNRLPMSSPHCSDGLGLARRSPARKLRVGRHGMERRRRRDLLVAGVALAALPARAAGRKVKQEEEVSPGEDLMREHGVLNRVLLVYDETVRRLENGEDGRLDVLAAAAGLIRRFIEGYHEKLEETQLFPRFDKAGKLTELVSVLRLQHAAGRILTGDVLKLAVPATAANTADRARLADALRKFVRMYPPHEAREDTVLFPAFHQLVGQKEYGRLGEQFEEKEHEALGENGFEKAVAQVGDLEKALGIFDLDKFTPR